MQVFMQLFLKYYFNIIRLKAFVLVRSSQPLYIAAWERTKRMLTIIQAKPILVEFESFCLPHKSFLS